MKTLLLPKVSRMIAALALLLTALACEKPDEIKTYWFFENATSEELELRFYPKYARDRIADLPKLEIPVSPTSTCLLVVSKEITINRSQLYFPDEFEYVNVVSKRTQQVLIRWDIRDSDAMGANLPENHFHKGSSWKKVMLNNGESSFTFTLHPSDIGM